jgi:hypothetical protein
MAAEWLRTGATPLFATVAWQAKGPQGSLKPNRSSQPFACTTLPDKEVTDRGTVTSVRLGTNGGSLTIPLKDRLVLWLGFEDRPALVQFQSIPSVPHFL